MEEPNGSLDNDAARSESQGIVQRQEELLSLEASAWSGPLPPPAHYQQYEEILPGAANRILEMAERQQIHTHHQEKAILENERFSLETSRIALVEGSKRNKLGRFLALVIALVGMGIGAWLTATGKGGYGLVFVFIPLASLIGVSVYGARLRRAEHRRSVGSDED